MKLSTADKQYITRKLHHAQNLFNTNHTAAGLVALGHIIASVASTVGSAEIEASTYQAITDYQQATPGSIDHAARSRQMQEERAIASVKPLCPSGLMAAIVDDGDALYSCPLCFLKHRAKVTAVPLSPVSMDFVGQESFVGISGRHSPGDRIVFVNTMDDEGRPIVGDVLTRETTAQVKETATVRIIK